MIERTMMERKVWDVEIQTAQPGQFQLTAHRGCVGSGVMEGMKSKHSLSYMAHYMAN